MLYDRKLLKDYFLWQMGLFRIPDSSVCSFKVNIRSDASMDPIFALIDAKKSSRVCSLVLFDNEDPIRMYVQCTDSCKLIYAYRESTKEGWTIIAPDYLRQFMNLSTVMTPLFSRMLDSSGILVLHSAAVVYNDRAVLFPGVPGIGKTTLAAGCLLTGMKYISDDTVLLRISDKVAFPLCTTIHLMPDTLSEFFEFTEMIERGEIRMWETENKGKKHMDISGLSSRFSTGAEAEIIIHPRILKNSCPEIVPADKNLVFSEIMHSGMQLLDEADNPLYRSRVAEEVCRMDCYDFLLSENTRDNAEYLKAFLEKIC